MKVHVVSARADREKAQSIVNGIRAFGYDVTADFGAIPGDETWADETIKNIQTADWILPIISAGFRKSEWSQRELLLAVSMTKRILPVVIESNVTLPLSIIDLVYFNASEDIHGAPKQIVDTLNMQQVDESNTVETSRKRVQSEEESKRILQDSNLARIFIAYSRNQRPIALNLYNRLISTGNAVFYDAKIRAGATWRQTIQKALDDATHVIVIWTSEAAKSDEVEREVGYALSEHKVIIPLLSKEIQKLPYHLHGLHYIILDDDLSQVEAELIKAIGQFKVNEDIWQ